MALRFIHRRKDGTFPASGIASPGGRDRTPRAHTCTSVTQVQVTSDGQVFTLRQPRCAPGSDPSPVPPVPPSLSLYRESEVELGWWHPSSTSMPGRSSKFSQHCTHPPPTPPSAQQSSCRALAAALARLRGYVEPLCFETWQAPGGSRAAAE
jgi:hypothetical protein